MRIKNYPFSNLLNEFGYLRFYSYCYNDIANTDPDHDEGNHSLTGLDVADGHASAGLTVYVMQGTEHMGTFHVAENTSEKALGIIQIQTYKNSVDEPADYWIMSFGNANRYDSSGSTTSGVDARSFAVAPVAVDLEDIR